MEKVNQFIETENLVGIVNYNLIINRFYDEWFLVNNDVIDIEDSLIDYLLSFFSEKKIDEALKMVKLKNEIKFTPLSKLSKTERKKFRLAFAFLSKKEKILLVDFDQGFFEKENSYFKQLFLKLANKYNIKFIVCTNNIEFFFGLVKKLVLCKPNGYAILENDIFYDNEIYFYLEQPKVVEFVKYLEKKEIKMEHYIELKELLKAIYRDVS